jgi:transcriptional regulator with XRE-family HTH domain
LPCYKSGMDLADWLKQSGKQKREFAKDIGVTPQMISAYLKGSIWPSKERMKRIAEKTDGAVTANDFLDSGAAQ